MEFDSIRLTLYSTRFDSTYFFKISIRSDSIRLTPYLIRFDSIRLRLSKRELPVIPSDTYFAHTRKFSCFFWVHPTDVCWRNMIRFEKNRLSEWYFEILEHRFCNIRSRHFFLIFSFTWFFLYFSRVVHNILLESTAQTLRDIRANFIRNERPSKTGLRSMSGVL